MGLVPPRSIFFPVDRDVVVDPGATATVIDLVDPARTIVFPLLYRASGKQLVAMAPMGTSLKEHHPYGCYITAGVSGLHPSARACATRWPERARAARGARIRRSRSCSASAS